MPFIRQTRLCVIDLGTNGFRMLVVEIAPDHSWRPIIEGEEVVHLAANGLASRFLTHDAMARAHGALQRLRDQAEEHGVDAWLVFATSAIRESDNGAQFIGEVFDRTGLRVRPITSGLEADLIHRGMRLAGPIDAPSLLVHIGGGSTAMVVADATGSILTRSYPLGAARLSERFVSTDPIDPGEVESLEAHFEAVLHEVIEVTRAQRVRRLVGSSSIAAHPEQAQAGAVLLEWLVGQMPLDEQRESPYALREGMVEWFIEHQLPWMAPAGSGLRRREVLLLRKRAGDLAPLAHAQHTRALALQLHDALASVLACKPADRELLGYAAMLHDLGRVVGRKGRQHHGATMVAQADWHTFSPREVRFLAALVRHHRGAAPTDEQLAELKPSHAKRVRRLAAVLRLAVALDRSGFQNVVDLDIEVRASQVALHLTTLLDPRRELEAARKAGAAFEAALGRKLTVRATRGYRS